MAYKSLEVPIKLIPEDEKDRYSLFLSREEGMIPVIRVVGPRLDLGLSISKEGVKTLIKDLQEELEDWD